MVVTTSDLPGSGSSAAATAAGLLARLQCLVSRSALNAGFATFASCALLSFKSFEDELQLSLILRLILSWSGPLIPWGQRPHPRNHLCHRRAKCH